MNKKELLNIRRATSDDYQVIASIYNEHIGIGISTMDEGVKTNKDIDGWEKNFNQREGLYVLKKSNKVIGWGIIKRYGEKRGYRFACETAIFLSGTETGKGRRRSRPCDC